MLNLQGVIYIYNYICIHILYYTAHLTSYNTSIQLHIYTILYIYSICMYTSVFSQECSFLGSGRMVFHQQNSRGNWIGGEMGSSNALSTGPGPIGKGVGI